MVLNAIRRLLLLLVLLASAPAWSAPSVAPELLQRARTQGPVRVLVMLREAPTDRHLSREAGKRQAQIARRIDAALARLPAGTVALRRRFQLIPGFALIADADTLVRLRDDPEVLSVDVDEPGSANGAPDAASILNRVSNLLPLGWGGTGMKLAVIDSGIDTTHPDLRSRLVAEQCFCSTGCCPNGKDTQSGAGSARDNNGHGTNVAGIMVGEGTVSRRGALPLAQLVAIKVLDRDGDFCCTSDVVAALDWLASNHPDVDAVNLSLGTHNLHTGHCDNASSSTRALAQAIAALGARGAVVTASTGNDGNSDQTEAPACVQATVGVAATWDYSGEAVTFLGCSEDSPAPKKPACFSNRSTTTDLYGAGAFVTSTGMGGGQSTYGGTSQAAPMAAACAAALKQAAPASTVEQRATALTLAPTTVADPVSGRSYPFLDCVAALEAITGRPTPVLSIANASVAEGDSGGRELRFTVSLSAPAPAGGVSFDVATADIRSAGRSATANRDYSALPTTMGLLAAGDTATTIRVKVFGDTWVEADEVLHVMVSNVTGALTGRAIANGLIINDDARGNSRFNEVRGAGSFPPPTWEGCRETRPPWAACSR